MLKKKYEKLQMEITLFTLPSDIITTSGLGDSEEGVTLPGIGGRAGSVYGDGYEF